MSNVFLRNKSDRIAFLSLFSSGVKFLVGPITLIAISASLGTEEIGFYFTFMSIVAAQQMMEFGLGNVIRQYYSHTNEKYKKYQYFSFSIIYYLVTSAIFILFGIISGIVVFSNYDGHIQWQLPWGLTIIAAALKNLTLPIGAYLDGIQEQEKLQKINLKASIISSLVLWLSLFLNFDLYSISLYLISSTAMFFLYSKDCICKKELFNFNIKLIYDTFKEVWVLLKRTTIVWLVGYLFWNGFNLIAFHTEGPEFAGILGFSIALARAGLDISSSLFINQVTYISNLISQGKKEDSLKILYKYLKICTMLIFTGFSIFIIMKILFPYLPVVNKTLDTINMIEMFLYYILVSIMVIINTYVRCFKIEPFVLLSTFNGLIIPIAFYISARLGIGYFLLPSFIILISVYISFRIFYKQITSKKVI